MPEEEYRLSYTGQQIDEAIGKALTGLPTITIAVSQVVSQNPLQIQLTNEQFATMNGHSVLLDVSALNMPVVIADYNGTYTKEGVTYLNFAFSYRAGFELYTGFNRVFVNTSTKVAELNFDTGYPFLAYQAERAGAINYSETAPTSANTDPSLEIVVLSSEPATRYDGYLYIITGSN